MSVVIEIISNFQATFISNIHNIGAKILMYISAPNIVYQLSELLPDFIATPVVWVLSRIYAIEWVELLSAVAVAMLIVERYYATKLSIAKRREIENDSDD